jgi:hypothetical protein
MKKTNTPSRSALSVSESRSPLTPTITNDFGKVSSTVADDPVLTPEQEETRILQLTSAARQLVKLGLSEPAFESLLKAYLIDPLNEHVLSCEKVVLPAWELTRKHARANSVPQKADNDRLKVLKARKEAERLEKEQAVWEKASGKPKVMQSTIATPIPHREKTL